MSIHYEFASTTNRGVTCIDTLHTVTRNRYQAKLKLIDGEDPYVRLIDSLNCEAIWAKLKVTGSKPLYIVSYYRPPDTNTFNIQQLDEALRKIPQPKETLPNVIVTGDFNVPDIDWPNVIIKGNPQYGRELNELMKDTLQENNLTQCNHKPTRYDNILYLVCTTNPDLITSITTAGGMSDHEIVISIVDMKAKTTKKKPRRVYIYIYTRTAISKTSEKT